MPEIEKQLAWYRTWQRRGIYAFISLVPATALTLWASGGTVLAAPLVIVVGGSIFALFSVAYFKVLRFRCPRCAECFTTKNRSGRSCANCGLPAYGSAPKESKPG